MIYGRMRKFQRESFSIKNLRTATEPVLNRPMAVYTASPFIGPVLGPMISGFINQVCAIPQVARSLICSLAMIEYHLEMDIPNSDHMDIHGHCSIVRGKYILPVYRRILLNRLIISWYLRPTPHTYSK